MFGVHYYTGLEDGSSLSLSRGISCVNPGDENAVLFLLELLNDYSAIVFQRLFSSSCETVLRSVQYGCFEGSEVYFDKNCFLAPVTKAVFRQRVKLISESIWLLPILLYQRIDNCLTEVQEEYEYVK